MRNIVKYVGIILVIAGILLVMKNLFTKENFNETKVKETYYSAKIALLDKEANSYLTGATLVLKKESGEIIEKWTTEDDLYIVNKLESGTYIIEQESAPENYHLNEEGVTFKIIDEDKKVTMYNTKMTEEEIRLQNTVSSEVGVDNTLSEKNIWSIIGGIAIIAIGLGLILIPKKSSNNDV